MQFHSVSGYIRILLDTIKSFSKKMTSIKQEMDKTTEMVENLVNSNKYEISLINSVSSNISSLESTFEEYEGIKKTLESMIKQSDVSKNEIEHMLVAYQDNIEKTGDS